MKKIMKVLTLMIASITLLGVLTFGVSAEWRSNSVGWWYTEGNSYATGWRNIDGKWYYFDSEGYMLHDTVIDGYQLGSDGSWVTTPPTIISTTNSESNNINNNTINIQSTTLNDNNKTENNSKTLITVFYKLDTLQVTRIIGGKQTLKSYYADNLDKKEEIESTYGLIIIDANDYNTTPEGMMDKIIVENQYVLVNNGGTVKLVKNS